jgi:hypothetical protein
MKGQLGKAIYFTRTARAMTRQALGITDAPCSWCGRRPVIGWVSKHDLSGLGDIVLCANCWRQLQAREQRAERQQLALATRLAEVELLPSRPVSPQERERLALAVRAGEVA